MSDLPDNIDIFKVHCGETGELLTFVEPLGLANQQANYTRTDRLKRLETVCEAMADALEYYKQNAHSWIKGSETHHAIEALQSYEAYKQERG